MLRVSYSDTADQQRWSLCGRLAGPWVGELRSFWKQTRERTSRARPIIDLSDITFIDEDGENLLAEMQKAGAEFVVSGVENKYVLATLKQGQRVLRRGMEHLRAPCGRPESTQGGEK